MGAGGAKLPEWQSKIRSPLPPIIGRGGQKGQFSPAPLFERTPKPVEFEDVCDVAHGVAAPIRFGPAAEGAEPVHRVTTPLTQTWPGHLRVPSEGRLGQTGVALQLCVLGRNVWTGELGPGAAAAR